MAKDTKERILVAALEMFSQKGYAGTNIRELSESLGLVKSAMYRHFESKDAIWNTLLDELIAYYEARFGSTEHLPPVPDSLEELVTMTMRMVNFTIHDEKVVKSRKLLSIEQFRDERARDLATKYFSHRSEGHVHADLCGYDEQETSPSGRSFHAGLCLHRADLRAHPPLRP